MKLKEYVAMVSEFSGNFVLANIELQYIDAILPVPPS